MASISSVNSYLYSSLFGNNTANSLYNNNGSIGSLTINTSTEKFKGNVTGYNPVDKTTNTKGASGLTSEDTKAYQAELKEFGANLKTATANLSSSGQSVFDKLMGASSKEEALLVDIANQNDAAKLSSAKNVTIQQLATAQKNTGNAINAQSSSGANSGTNQFTIDKGGKTYQFSVNINETDSARTAQQKTADAINKANIGLSATVNFDSKTGKSSLVVASRETGEKNAFEISDVEGKGNLVSALGVGNTTQAAQDARYTVDGEAKTSDKNTVDLGNGLTGTLKKATSEAVTVTAEKDVNAITNAIYDVVNNFNGLYQASKEYGDDKGAQALQQRLDSITSSYASSLKNIGITKNKDGYLEIDTDKLQKAFEDGAAERYLGNENAGFTQRLSQVAKAVDSDPDRYVSYQSRNNMHYSSADTYNDNPYQNYLSAYKQTQLSNMRLLFSNGV